MFHSGAILHPGSMATALAKAASNGQKYSFQTSSYVPKRAINASHRDIKVPTCVKSARAITSRFPVSASRSESQLTNPAT